jgi:hypothetical protein
MQISVSIETGVFFSLAWMAIQFGSTKTHNFKSFWASFRMILDHILPMVVLIVDNFLLNAIPFLRRQYMLILGIAFGFMFFMMGSILHLGQTFSPFVSGNGFSGIVLVPSGIFLFTLISMLLFEKYSMAKLQLIDQDLYQEL